MTVLPSYRNQSIDLHSKSIDWFLYEGSTGTLWVNIIFVLKQNLKNLCNFIYQESPTPFEESKGTDFEKYRYTYFLKVLKTPSQISWKWIQKRLKYYWKLLRLQFWPCCPKPVKEHWAELCNSGNDFHGSKTLHRQNGGQMNWKGKIELLSLFTLTKMSKE